MYPLIGTNALNYEPIMNTKPRYKVLAYIGKRDISKYTDSEIEARRILQELKEAASTLSLLDVFRGEIHEVS